MPSRSLPHAPGLDSTLALLRQGYPFLSKTADELGTDIFACRLMLRKAVCLRGPEAARAFYTPGRLTRKGAMPVATLMLLQDFGSVQMLDGEAHRHRKQLFMSLMTPQAVAHAASIFREEWQSAFSRRGRTVLLDQASSILCRTALRWCGLPPDVHDHPRRTAEFASMVTGAGRIGWLQIKGHALRARSERWARKVIASLRQGEAEDDSSPARKIALARDEKGDLLPLKIAAIELINLLRPTVAVARFIVFAAHALYLHGRWREQLAGDPRARRAFAQEVRRFYPFFPAIGGHVREPFAFAGHRFARGEWVLLDIHGTDHHRSWGDPETFRPERFLRPFDGETRIVAQGSGDFVATHHCPGEDLTVALLAVATGLLATMRYSVPEQNLSIPLNRFPTAPKSGFVIRI